VIAAVSVPDAVGLATSIMSLVLGVAAIWLALMLYRRSQSSQDRLEDASKEIRTSTANLESLYDRLYTGLFDMTRDTVADLRRYFLKPREGSEEVAAPSQSETPKEQLVTELLDEFRPRTHVDGGGLRADDLAPLVATAIDRTRKADAAMRRESIRRFLADELHSVEAASIPADQLVATASRFFPGTEIVRELENMRDDGLVRFSSQVLNMSSAVFLQDSAE
jgi:hypothetical protein